MPGLKTSHSKDYRLFLLRKKLLRQHFLDLPREGFGKRVEVQTGLVARQAPRLGPDDIEPRLVAELAAKTWGLVQPVGDFLSLRANRVLPTLAAGWRLVLPLQKMSQKNRHAARQFALLAFAHVLDLLCDVLDVDGGQLARAQQCGLLIGPRHNVLFVSRSHDCSVWRQWLDDWCTRAGRQAAFRTLPMVLRACSKTLSGHARRRVLSGAAKYAFHVDSATGNAWSLFSTVSASAWVSPDRSISARNATP